MESTAQPKQPYSIPSFKKLFLQTCTMRNFRNTKPQILQELQTSFRNKAVRNLSSHQLSPSETEILALGLNFVPTPLAYTHHLILVLTNHLTRTMKFQFQQFHFRNEPLTTKRPTYYTPSKWTTPEPNSTKLTLFLEQPQNLIPNPPPYVKRPNLTSQQRSTLKKLGSNPNLVIKPFSKGSGICSWTPPLHQ